MSCSHDCFVIGGPWIDEDPNCPIHGREAQEAQEAKNAQDAEIDALKARIKILEDKINK